MEMTLLDNQKLPDGTWTCVLGCPRCYTILDAREQQWLYAVGYQPNERFRKEVFGHVKNTEDQRGIQARS